MSHDPPNLVLNAREEAMDQAVGDLRTAVVWWAFLRWAVLLSAGYLLVWGTATLAGRAAGLDVSRWWYGGLGLLLMGGLAGWLGWRQRPSADRVRALLDHRRRLGGLLMSVDAPGHEAWSAKMKHARSLRVRWRGGPALGALAAAVVYLLGAAWVPMPGVVGQVPMDVSRAVDELQGQVAVLEEERLIDQPQAEAWEEELARLGEEAIGTDPAKTWEALDHVGQQLEKNAAEAADFAQRAKEDAAAAKLLAEALAITPETLSPEQMSAAMDALAQLTDQAMGDATLPPELAQAMNNAANAGLTPEALKQLAQLVANREGDLDALLEALQNADLIEGQGDGELVAFDPEALKEWLACQEEGDCGSDKVCKAAKMACRGGITRGPGHAEMIWKDPVSKEDASFEPQVLPPTRVTDAGMSQRLGVSRSTPQTRNDATGSTGGALGAVNTTGGSAQNVTILPRHRGAVQRYFDRTAAEEKPSD